MKSKDKVFSHAGALLGGLVHNLNTPLMWIMGRAQLIEARNDMLDKLKELPDEEIQKVKQKNKDDIDSILEGSDRIDSILKAVSYKAQMAQGDVMAIDVKEYLKMEVDFLMADMRFKHETKREILLDAANSFYARIDYNILSSGLTESINILMDATDKNRTIKITLDNGVIRIACPDAEPLDETKNNLNETLKELSGIADVYLDETDGITISIHIRES